MIVDGKAIAEELKNELRIMNHELRKQLRLAIILVACSVIDSEVAQTRGEQTREGDPSTKLRASSPSSKFVEMKKKFGEGVGIETKVYEFGENVSTTELRKELAEICGDKKNDGVIIQLPLPPQINTQYILDGIPIEKDVDVLSAKAMGKFMTGRGILPPVVGAVKEILERHNVEVKGKNVVVLGAGKLVGAPVATWLMQQGATVSVLNEFSHDSEFIIHNSDIITSGVGKPGILTAQMVKDGVVIIDAGTSEQSGKLIGDVSPDVANKASLFTPVPSGVGPITVAMLFKNLFALSLKK